MLKGVASKYRKSIEEFQSYQRERSEWRDPLAVWGVLVAAHIVDKSAAGIKP